MITKEQFIADYCSYSGISESAFHQRLVALRCACDADSCRGWAAINSNLDSIEEHNELHSPEAVAELGLD